MLRDHRGPLSRTRSCRRRLRGLLRYHRRAGRRSHGITGTQSCHARSHNPRLLCILRQGYPRTRWCPSNPARSQSTLHCTRMRTSQEDQRTWRRCGTDTVTRRIRSEWLAPALGQRVVEWGLQSALGSARTSGLQSALGSARTSGLQSALGSARTLGLQSALGSARTSAGQAPPSAVAHRSRRALDNGAVFLRLRPGHRTRQRAARIAVGRHTPRHQSGAP